MKRFTETSKWSDKWFRKLSPKLKLLWMYICDTCDQAGVIELDIELAGFQIGERLKESDLQEFGDRIETLPNGKLHIVKFIQFQYGKLSDACKPHMPVLAALRKHGLDANGVLQNAHFRNSVDECTRKRIIKRDGNICAYIGLQIAEEDIAIDHIFPKSKGGRNTDDNLVVAHRDANNDKADQHVIDYIRTVGLDESVVLERLSKRTGKPIEAFRESFEGYLVSLKEKEEDKDKEKEQVKEKERAFVAFWEAYPKKAGKEKALKAWMARKDLPPLDELLGIVASQAKSRQWQEEKGRYIPHASTWLNNGRWTDEVAVKADEEEYGW